MPADLRIRHSVIHTCAEPVTALGADGSSGITNGDAPLLPYFALPNVDVHVDRRVANLHRFALVVGGRRVSRWFRAARWRRTARHARGLGRAGVSAIALEVTGGLEPLHHFGELG